MTTLKFKDNIYNRFNTYLNIIIILEILEDRFQNHFFNVFVIAPIYLFFDCMGINICIMYSERCKIGKLYNFSKSW